LSRLGRAGAQVFGRIELFARRARRVLGDVAHANRCGGCGPDKSAARVGEHSAVVWKRLYLRPPAASFSRFGVSHGPPNTARRAEARVVDQHDEHVRARPSAGRSGSIFGYFVSGSARVEGS